MGILCTVVTLGLVWRMCRDKSRKNKRLRQENEHKAMQQQVDYVERREKLIAKDLWPPAPDPVILPEGVPAPQNPTENPWGKGGARMKDGVPRGPESYL